MRLTPEREKQLRKLHTDNRYGVLELLEEINALRNDIQSITFKYLQTIGGMVDIAGYEVVQKERDALKAKLERTKEHWRKQREENEEVEQKVFDEQEEVIAKFRNALEEILDVNSEDDWADATRIAKKALEE